MLDKIRKISHKNHLIIRYFMVMLVNLWIAGFVMGCKDAQLSPKNSVATPRPTSPTLPPPVRITDKYIQKEADFTAPIEKTKLDILICIDNSSSMSREQELLGSRFNSLISSIEHFNYQIGFITSDMSKLGNQAGPTQGGHLLQIAGTGDYILRSTDTGKNRKFMDTIRRSETGSSDERCIYSLITALEKNEYGIIRNNADLAMIIISDEDERGQGGTHGIPLQKGKDYAQDLINVAKRIKKGNTTFTTHAIIVKPEDNACYREQDSQGTNATPQYGRQYEAAAKIKDGKARGGVVGSVCANDYASQLEDISRTIVRTSPHSVELDCVPNIDENEDRHFIVEGFSEDEYRVDGQSLIFDPPLQSGQTVHYSYWCRK